VIVTRITTDEPIEGMLRMQFERFDSETEHASEDINRKNTRAEKIRRCRELHNQGKSIREIARELGISKSSAHEILQETPPVSLDSPTANTPHPNTPTSKI
jgi:transposase-like protein